MEMINDNDLKDDDKNNRPLCWWTLGTGVDFGCRDLREPLDQAYLLALGVQGGGGLIQQQDLGVTDDRPGDGDALFLAAGELWTLGAHVCVVFLRQQERFKILLQGSEKPFYSSKTISPICTPPLPTPPFGFNLLPALLFGSSQEKGTLPLEVTWQIHEAGLS